MVTGLGQPSQVLGATWEKPIASQGATAEVGTCLPPFWHLPCVSPMFLWCQPHPCSYSFLSCHSRSSAHGPPQPGKQLGSRALLSVHHPYATQVPEEVALVLG